MSTIEQAAKRLEQLRRAGVDVNPDAPSTAPSRAPAPIDTSAATPAAVIHTPITDDADVAPSDSGRRSRQVDVDTATMSRLGLLVPGEPRSQLEEEFRIVKRPLLENIRGQTAARPQRANLIMVTSALPGEGKTQTAINLATSIAMELDHTVLLVEADVIRPSVMPRLGLEPTSGLMDLLEKPELELADVLLRTNIPKLTVLPAGTISSRSTELLASAMMDNLLEELANKYSDRVIIFDTPPLLSTTESRVLASHMGQVLMVVEAGKTPISTVRQAFATIEQHPVVLAMLNKYQGPKVNPYGYYAA